MSYSYTSMLIKYLVTILKRNCPKIVKKGIHIDIQQSAKVWATPIRQLILKSDKVSRLIKMTG